MAFFLTLNALLGFRGSEALWGDRAVAKHGQSNDIPRDRTFLHYSSSLSGSNYGITSHYLYRKAFR